ncbi:MULTISPECIES: DUF397 domain-containing protein [Actinomadura]|uniref:DUF397 domain-containing protein n=1 Tax=Actinomadura yumaensis TaxID=111807 RepID=A0ABW2C9U2_9ACTN|nr:DUF397 domain-containing protein [Actinomadura sp. J1-007]MWK33720.1 DUF397 domain-containing protein [Actinomadura sp. J1-007]
MDTVIWRKASRSNDQGAECVEVAALSAGVGVRDSKDPDGPRLLLSREAFRALAADIKR